MLFFYNIFLSLYFLVVRIYVPFNGKAKKWIEGRKNWEQHFKDTLKPGEKRIWIHCSSMGEFEQAKPLMEEFRIKYPDYKILVTFFSPSGYEACKKSNLADYIFYLPHDSKQNAEKFIKAVNPSIALFVKYEFWYYYLVQLKKHNIPALLISGAFRKEQAFFKWYGGLFRDMLKCFEFFFLQNEQSRILLNKIGFGNNNILISGDTRYDRVSVISQNFSPVPAIEKFKGDAKILIAGSTWPGDEDVIKDCISLLPQGWKLIIVPHEIGESHIRKLQQLFGNEVILFSELDTSHSGQNKKILIINNIGLLSRLFAYGDIAYIGGGFQSGGIHNILEPAVFGVPVIFGPIYEKFVEAKELASLQYVFPINDASSCSIALNKLITDDQYRLSISGALKTFMKTHTGATAIITNEIRRKKWLD
jgi:3-deoxy-D-manno-octulosonic-acid transferase